MKFKHSAFIRRNTPELRKNLEDLGWRARYVQECSDTIVAASNTGAFSAIVRSDQEWFEDYKNECIDCGTNESLFLAIAAIREDSDYMQWFYKIVDNEKVWHLCKNDEFYVGGYWKDKVTEWDKASPKELEEHFKEREV